MSNRDPGFLALLGNLSFVSVSSTAVIAPFYIDPEHLFVLQMRGNTKTQAFTREGRGVLSEH